MNEASMNFVTQTSISLLSIAVVIREAFWWSSAKVNGLFG